VQGCARLEAGLQRARGVDGGVALAPRLLRALPRRVRHSRGVSGRSLCSGARRVGGGQLGAKPRVRCAV